MSLPNVAHSDKFSVTFSNIPGYVPSVGSNVDNMNLYDLYVKEVNFPGMALTLVQTNFRNYEINHPSSKSNDNLGDITITFKMSEGMLNYYYIFRWIKNLRETVNVNSEEFFRNNFIKQIRLSVLDNQKRAKFYYDFSNGFVIDLSSINFTNGIDEEITFTVTIKYEDVQMVVGEC